MKKNIILNFCSRVSLFCLNHDEPLPMEVISNTEQIKTPFYACQNYIPEDGLKPCSNRLNLDDYLGITEELASLVLEEDNPFADFTNYEFDYVGSRRKIHVKCLRYSPKEIRLGIKNQTVLGS